MQFRIPRWLVWLDDQLLEPARDWLDLPTRWRIGCYRIKRYDIFYVLGALIISVVYTYIYMPNDWLAGMSLGVMSAVLLWMIAFWMF